MSQQPNPVSSSKPLPAIAGPRRIRHPVRPRVVGVRRVDQLSPRMLRVRLVGPQLAGFCTAAPTDHVKLFFPAERGAQPRMPPGGVFDANRFYTVRSFAAGIGELDTDIVLHGDGVATRWAAGVRPGDRLGVLGPRGSVLVSPDFDWYLLAVDETGLPAAARWLEELRPGARAILLAEVADPQEELELTSSAEVTVRWLHRDRAADGVLERAIRHTELPLGDGFVWVAGEAGALKPIRGYLRDELCLDPAHYEVEGYWKRGVADHNHHGAVD